MNAVVNPNSLMPPAARRQAEEANRIIAELNAKPGSVPAGTEVQTMPDNQRPGGNENNDRSRWVPASETQQTQHIAPPSSDQTVVVEQPAEDFRQKYSTLKGKYDAEMRSMREIMATQQQTMDKLIEQRQSHVAPTTPAKTEEQSNEEYLMSLGISAKEMEDYGELLPIVAKLARNMIRPTAAKLEAELNQTKAAAGTVATAQLKSAQESLFATMDAHFGARRQNWRATNEDEMFLEWLEQVDIFSGSSRRQSLSAAFQALDAARLIAIFEKFYQEDSVRRSTSGPAVDANTLIAPGVPRGGAAEAPGGAADKRIWSETEVRNFYTRVRKKTISPEEYKRFSADLATAAQEGRIRPDRTDHHQNRN
jgi:hypothetical protein